MWRWLCIVLVSLSVCAKPPPAAHVFKFSANLANDTVVLHWNIAKKAYLYKKRFSFKVLAPKTARLSKIQLPQGEIKQDEIFGRYQIYTKDVSIPIPIAYTGKQNVVIQVGYQGCSSNGYCYPPIVHKVRANFRQQLISVDKASMSSVTSTQSEIVNLLAHGNIIIILLSFFGFGILLAFTPCVLPMIPILSGIIAGEYKTVNMRRAFILSLIYVLSMALTYAVAGVIVSLLGKNVQILMQNRWVLIVFSLIFVFLALSLFGLFEISLPQKWQQRIVGVSQMQKKGSYFGAAIMGVLATLIVSPCVTPPLIGALIYIAKAGNVILGGSALFVLGLGMGLPLLLVGTVLGKFLPKAGKWMRFVKIIFGILMLLVAAWILMRLVPTTTDIQGLHFYQVNSVAQVKQQVQKAKAEHKPILLDFYADWCVACKVMDRTTYADPKVQQTLKKFVLLRADVTTNNKPTQQLMRRFNVVAPPTLVFFNPNGKELIKYQLVGEMGPKKFYRYMQKLR